MRRSLTLIELIIIIVLISVVIIGVTSASLFFIRQVNQANERYNIYSQITYVTEDMKIRCAPAADVVTTFSSSGGTRNDFSFYGERDLYSITPDETADNVVYEYRIDNQGRLILDNKTDNKIEVLVDARYEPTLEFTYKSGDEPNFITVKVQAKGEGDDAPAVSRVEGLRFWFIDVVS